MHFSDNLELAQLHMDDMEQRANHQRLVKAVQQREKRENTLLVTVGRQMVALGQKLEAMGHSEEMVTLQPEVR